MNPKEGWEICQSFYEKGLQEGERRALDNSIAMLDACRVDDVQAERVLHLYRNWLMGMRRQHAERRREQG